MENNSRRDFLKKGISLAAFATGFNPLTKKRKQPKLSFSTLGCPDWPFDKIISVANQNGYNGIEMRGIKRELDLPICPEFNSKEAIITTNQKMKDHNLQFVDLGSSANLHFADEIKRKDNLAQAKRFIDLAEKINCPFIRVFPNDLPKDQDDAKTIELITTALIELGEYARGSSVEVLLESHGKVIYKDILFKIMQSTENHKVGMIWDIWNMWSVTKENPADVYNTLKKYIKHTHIKDGIIEGEKDKYVLLGKGISPLPEAIALLKKGGYEGYYSFEWEKLWHPEIEEPEIAIPHFAANFAKLYNFV